MKLKNIILTIMIFAIGITANAYYCEELVTPYTPNKDEIILKQANRAVSAVNPTMYSNRAGGYYPGSRGANQLILYTSEYGERTHTNEFGTEAIIVGNTVTELSGADSFIPENGAVISGHGTAKNWINNNITIGTKVYYDELTGNLIAYTTSESLLFEAKQKITEAKNMIDYYRDKNSDYDWSVPNSYIKDAENYLKKASKRPENAQNLAYLATQSANSALKSVIPYKNTEFKGVWLRPTETTEADIIKSVQRIKKSGIDNVFIETYFHGKTIFPSETMEEYGFIEQNENFEGIDPLKIWIREAHKNGIKVHIWFETFYVGNDKPSSNPKSILAVRPDWGNKTRQAYNKDGATPSLTEHNGYFLDPANSEVQEFLQSLICEIINNYKPDGINLDYIRYPQALSLSPMGTWGYSESARNEFYNTYGKDPVELTATDGLWEYWNLYKRGKVTNFVEKIGKIGKTNNVYISTVIFPDIKSARNYKQQDWQTWSLNGYVNGFTPLFLTCNSKTLNSMVNSITTLKSANTDLYAGLFVTFMGGSEEDLIREIHETRKLDIGGVILFDFAHLDDKYVNALGARVFADNNSVKLKKIDPSDNSETGPKKKLFFKKK